MSVSVFRDINWVRIVARYCIPDPFAIKRIEEAPQVGMFFKSKGEKELGYFALVTFRSQLKRWKAQIQRRKELHKELMNEILFLPMFQREESLRLFSEFSGHIGYCEEK